MLIKESVMNRRENHTNTENKVLSRRRFLQLSKDMLIGAGLLGLSPGVIWVNEAVAAVPVSQGYLLVDTHKCQGCVTCMLACSLAHHGKASLSLARLQVSQNSFLAFPHDLSISQCRQCRSPECVNACDYEACYISSRHGNVRMIDAGKCVGCGACIEACPYTPNRTIWNHEEEKAQKCDLCADTPYWNEKGSANDKQACVEMCPVKAIAFTAELPEQDGDGGYEVNLRNETWEKLGFPTD